MKRHDPVFNCLLTALSIMFCFSGLPITVSSSLGTWSSRQPMPTVRDGSAAAELNGEIYVLGGEHLAIATNIAEVFTPLTNSWRLIAQMNSPRRLFGASGANGKVYAIGGGTVSAVTNTVEAYDPGPGPNANTWTYKMPMITPRHHFGTATIGNKIYAIGGHTGSGPTAAAEVYDTDTDQWQPLPSMQVARYALSAAAVNGKIYAIGGLNSSFASLTTVEQYDPDTNHWTFVSSLPATRYGHAAATMGGRIYAIGGLTGNGSVRDTQTNLVEEYDSSSDSWSAVAPMITARSNPSAVGLTDFLYVFGGGTPGDVPTGVTEEFGFGADVWTHLFGEWN